MLSDGGCIKDVQIRLLLSSRNEMQKVIDSARQQTLYNAYMQQNMMQQPQIPIVGSLPPLTAKVCNNCIYICIYMKTAWLCDNKSFFFFLKAIDNVNFISHRSYHSHNNR